MNPSSKSGNEAQSSKLKAVRLLGALLFPFSIFHFPSSPALAGMPEPGARLFGTVALNGVTVTAADTAVVIEALSAVWLLLT